MPAHRSTGTRINTVNVGTEVLIQILMSWAVNLYPRGIMNVNRQWYHPMGCIVNKTVQILIVLLFLIVLVVGHTYLLDPSGFLPKLEHQLLNFLCSFCIFELYRSRSYDMSDQHRARSSCASAQSYQVLRCSLHVINCRFIDCPSDHCRLRLQSQCRARYHTQIEDDFWWCSIWSNYRT